MQMQCIAVGRPAGAHATFARARSVRECYGAAAPAGRSLSLATSSIGYRRIEVLAYAL
jgi:hypothetical protein